MQVAEFLVLIMPCLNTLAHFGVLFCSRSELFVKAHRMRTGKRNAIEVCGVRAHSEGADRLAFWLAPWLTPDLTHLLCIRRHHYVGTRHFCRVLNRRTEAIMTYNLMSVQGLLVSSQVLWISLQEMVWAKKLFAFILPMQNWNVSCSFTTW